jgi:hypothetical protein
VNESLIATANKPYGVAVAVPVAQVSPAAPAAFARTPNGTLSAPATLTLTNAGEQALSLTGLSFEGADPGDFIVTSDSCMGALDPGDSCQFTVSFAPQAKGSRAATLLIASNDYANSPLQIPLEGTGASLPTGPRGPAGKIELVICKTVKVKDRKLTRQKCTGKLVSGKVTFKITGASMVHASLTRAGIVCATGASLSIGHGRSRLILAGQRPLQPGTYTLILRRDRGRRWITTTRKLTIS